MPTKPDLTLQQQQSYDKQLREIFSDASQTVQDIWNIDNSITWAGNEVIIQEGIANKLTGKLADRYTILENQRIDRNIKI